MRERTCGNCRHFEPREFFAEADGVCFREIWPADRDDEPFDCGPDGNGDGWEPIATEVQQSLRNVRST